jgi:predicted nuclease with TOPRIM domain
VNHKASIQLEAARAEAEAQKKLSGEADLEYAAAKSDLRATLAHSKDTIGQLKELCARLETDLEGKQAALQAVREEMAAMRAAEVELRESFDRLRAENNFLAATKVCKVWEHACVVTSMHSK